MPGITRLSVDSAGGPLSSSSSDVFVNGSGAVRISDSVTPHAPGGVHLGAVMVGSSSTVFVNKRGVCRQGDPASCGHPATGSSNVFAGG
jgi:uncharacterized Zn-binding protein involved in type VI secretion